MTVAAIQQAAAALGPAWGWALAGLALAGAEILVPGVFLIWLGLAALATGLLAALLPAAWQMPWQGQALLFAGLAVALVGLAVRLHRRGLSRAPGPLNRPDRGLVGREGPLTEPIAGGVGRVRFDDTLWRVAGPDLPAGARVRVVRVEGTVLRVEAA